MQGAVEPAPDVSGGQDDIDEVRSEVSTLFRQIENKNNTNVSCVAQ
jgi:hypothetical protein